MDGWVTVLARCEECEHSWSTLIPVSWDGSPLCCSFCGEIAVTVAEGR